MNIKIRRKYWKVEIDMIKQLEDIIENFSVTIECFVTSPATDELYVQILNAKELSGDRKDEFHSVTQKLLHVTKIARLDIDTVVAYLYTRVRKNTEGDW